MPGIANKIIFLAEVCDEMKKYKINLIKELEHNGCIIKEVSNSDLELDGARDIIENCEVAIHLLSDEDFSKNESGKGFEEMQINYSVQKYLSQKLLANHSENGFKIYAWHPKSTSENIFTEESLAGHLKRIQLLDEVELLRTNFEEFKYYLLNKIDIDSNEEVDEFYIKGTDHYCIYFLYDLVDAESVREYIEYLNKRGFIVLTPDFSSDILSTRQMHTNNLKKFDLAIIYAHAASADWTNMKIMDILKSPGLGRGKRILGKAVFTSEQKMNSLPMRGRGFEMVSIDLGSVKSQLDEFLHNLSN